MPSPVDEIKRRLDIIELIQEYIQIKPAGVNFRALCPFHNEKTPSLIISPEKQIWHCFGCGKGGDIFAFIKEIEGLEFVEALKILAARAGVKLSFNEPKFLTSKNNLWQLNREIANFWQKNLFEAKNANVYNYLKKRGLEDATIKLFFLGYASDTWQEAADYLKSRGYSEKDILQSGIGVMSEKNQGIFDRFRNRIIFPINDLQGNIVGFGGRIFETAQVKADEAKYLNSPQTAVYNKGLVLYGLDKSKMEIKKKDYVIIVEGYLDLISAFQVGTKNVIASSGTALAAEQIKILKRYTQNIMICFDADQAGQKAAERGIDLALHEEMNVKVIDLGEDKDPDECIRRDKERWFNAIKNAQHFVDYYFNITLKNLDLSRPDHKKKAASILLGVISRLTNLIEQTHYLQKLGKILDVSETILREILMKKNSQKKKYFPKAEPPPLQKVLNKKLVITERLLALALKYPKYISVLIDNLEPTVITQNNLRDLYKLLVNYYNLNQTFYLTNFLEGLSEKNIIDETNKLSLLAESEFLDWEDNLLHNELINGINYLKKDYYSNKLTELTEAIKISEKIHDEERLSALSEEFNRLSKELKQIEI